MVKYTLQTYTQEKYNQDRALIDAVESDFSINFANPNRHLGDKISILSHILGYKGLRVGANKGGDPFLSLDNCRSSRINNVLRESYNAALSRVFRFGNPSERGIDLTTTKISKLEDSARKRRRLFKLGKGNQYELF